MHKIDFFKTLQCMIFLFEEMPEIEINKHFNFQEMDKSKKILEQLKC